MSNLVNPFIFAGVVELARDTAFYTSTSTSSSYTSDARAIGTASATRRVYALLFAATNSATGRTLSSVSIGGQSATVHINQTDNSVNNSMICAIASAVVSSGTTADVQATFSNTMNYFLTLVISLDNLNSGTPVDTDQFSDDDNNDMVVSLNYSSGGYAMAITGCESLVSPGTVSWAQMTETAEQEISSSEFAVASAAYEFNTSEGTGVTTTATWTENQPRKLIVGISVR